MRAIINSAELEIRLNEPPARRLRHPAGCFFTPQSLLMPRQTKAIIHQAIYRVFADAWNSSTPFSTVAHWCIQVKETSGWSADDIDQVADTVLRMVALLQPRPPARSSAAETDEAVWQPGWIAVDRPTTSPSNPSFSASLASVESCDVYAFADQAAG